MADPSFFAEFQAGVCVPPSVCDDRNDTAAT